jgi:hypothetical protein
LLQGASIIHNSSFDPKHVTLSMTLSTILPLEIFPCERLIICINQIQIGYPHYFQ